MKELSLFNGFEYKTATKTVTRTSKMYQWETLMAIAKEVGAPGKEVTGYNYESDFETLYKENANQVLKVLEPREKSEDLLLVGVYGGNKSKFADLLVETLGSRFDGSHKISNVTKKACQQDGVSEIIQEMCSALKQTSTWNDVRRSQQLLEKKRYLVVLDDLENSGVDQIRNLLGELKRILGRNKCFVVLASRFQHILRELNVHEFINLLTLEDKRGILHVCYTKRDDISDAFLNQLQETFDMLGLDVRLLSNDELINDSSCLHDAKVILCIISRSFSIDDFKSMLTSAAIPSKIVYISYGSYPTDESSSTPLFRMEVDLQKEELNKDQFKSMVWEVVRILNERHEKIMEDVDFPVGVAQRSNAIGRSMLDYVSMNDKSVQCFGLVGMGGIGKTTIAMSIYNKLNSRFNNTCFTFNTRTEVEKKGLVAVQKKILTNLLGIEEKDIGEKIMDKVHGKNFMRFKLTGINALVVLDDVDKNEHVDALCEPLCQSLGPKSIVIFTSRNKTILKPAHLTKIFDIEELDREMSKWLFYWHAFMKPQPPADLQEVSLRVIEACKGLPLSLKVIGSHLYGKTDRNTWEESFDYLRVNEQEIFNVLRISFNGLDNNQKQAFLDICCFLIDEDEDFACMVVEACHKMGRTYLCVLKERCLITVTTDKDSNERRIRMHDQLRDMGRHIIEQESRDRAWDEETAHNILKDVKLHSSLRGLSVWSHIPFPVEASGCQSLPELRILVVNHQDEHGKPLVHEKPDQMELCPQNLFNSVRCSGLRWLRWRKAPFEQLPDGLRSRDTQVLELPQSKINKLPIDSLPNLKRLDVNGCYRLTGLDPNIQRLTNLKHLDLACCYHIKYLPKEMTGLSSLQHIHVSYCLSLTALAPPTTLRELIFRHASRLKIVDLNASLPKLEKLVMTDCSTLKRFSLDAPSLRELDLSDCDGLEELECKGLSSLQRISLNGCSSLTTLSFPTTLRQLRFWDAFSLKIVDVNASLPKLEKLAICSTHQKEESRIGVSFSN
ncbi:hypothetical protein KP509_05G037800 [Ceratopteris richardii]|uniref:Uncharacterized protein n=1 Tax=Ceratopteris richardii TaxID=49495 RepID=A0A8T2UL06_CERRI|nr:hypothetical protein KP509_05G037800 [Ceratopteris richardii]